MDQPMDQASTHYDQGNALLKCGRQAEAVEAYRCALGLRAHFPSAWNNLGMALYQLGQVEESAAALRNALELEPEFAYAYNNLAVALKDLGRTAEALSLYDRAIGLRKHGFERALMNKAMLLMEIGELAGARRAADEALGFNPNLVTAWHLRVTLKTVGPADPDLEALESLLEPADLLSMTDADRIRLRFALGKAWLDAGDADRAFAHLAQGNQLERATFEYDSALALERMDAVARTFTPGLLQQFAGTGAGHPTEAPVFIIGMPRSGTSLVEQILASHPSVHGAGELAFLHELVPGVSAGEPYHCPPLYPPLLEAMSPGHLANLGREYESRLRRSFPDKARVIDKMPANFLYAGFIHLILPNARIIHCRRDPLDTCLSCYVQMFNGSVVFAYDQGELGGYYRHYELLADRWRDVLPRARYMEVRYEDVVENLECEARRLVEFCGLPWSEQCLRFQQTQRPVRTASASAVRNPIYRTSIGRSRDHARHLGTLIDALAG
jgi:tetratricopeptide (TPR) repeat protein